MEFCVVLRFLKKQQITTRNNTHKINNTKTKWKLKTLICLRLKSFYRGGSAAVLHTAKYWFVPSFTTFFCCFLRSAGRRSWQCGCWAQMTERCRSQTIWQSLRISALVVDTVLVSSFVIWFSAFGHLRTQCDTFLPCGTNASLRSKPVGTL